MNKLNSQQVEAVSGGVWWQVATAVIVVGSQLAAGWNEAHHEHGC